MGTNNTKTIEKVSFNYWSVLSIPITIDTPDSLITIAITTTSSDYCEFKNFGIFANLNYSNTDTILPHWSEIFYSLYVGHSVPPTESSQGAYPISNDLKLDKSNYVIPGPNN